MTWDQQRWANDLMMRQLERERKEGQLLREQQRLRKAAIEEFFFAEKFNKLVTTLQEFVTHFNSGSVDARKVKAVQKAWRELEKTDGWFKRTQSNEKEAEQARQERACHAQP
jgi:hypothetical protein